MVIGCSRHVPRDKSKLFSWKPVEKGNLTFGNNAPSKIVGKGLFNLVNGRGKSKDVLFVDGLKHNLLIMS